MESDPKTLARAVLELVAEYTGVSVGQISLDTAINVDLGVDGDDAAELMEAFSSKFRVDLSRFRFDRYFGNEPSLLSLFEIGRAIETLTVRDLVQMADSRTWEQI